MASSRAKKVATTVELAFYGLAFFVSVAITIAVSYVVILWARSKIMS